MNHKCSAVESQALTEHRCMFSFVFKSPKWMLEDDGWYIIEMVFAHHLVIPYVINVDPVPPDHEKC